MSLPAHADYAPLRLRRELRWIVVALLAVAAWDASPADLWLVQRYGDAHGFAWNHHWLTAGVLHEGGRWLAAALLGWLALAVVHPVGPARHLSREGRLWWLVVTVLNLLLISGLKRLSLTSCPSELALFGGHSRYVSHWALGMADGGPGHCFPSGHASSAFAFLSGYFALREAPPAPWARRPARLWLAATMVLGLAFGWGQMMRGSHYLSHTLWTAWFCGVFSLASAHVAVARGWLAAGAEPTGGHTPPAGGAGRADAGGAMTEPLARRTLQSPNNEA